MEVIDVVTSMSPLQLFIAFFFYFYWAFLWLGLHWLLFGNIKLKSPRYEWNTFTSSMSILMSQMGNKRHYDNDWEEEDYATGDAYTHSGPAIRHPKNVDRAYEGSA